MLDQTFAVILMNVRSIPDRFWMSLVTIIGIAVVVAVLLAFLAMGNGFRATLQGSGSEDMAIVMRSGAQSEINSVLTAEQMNLIATAPGVANDERGPIISAELYLIVDAVKRSTQTQANLPFRGLSVKGAEMRDNISISEGRMFEPGKNEIVVGRAVLSEYEGFELGSKISLGTASWEVVGIFDAPGSVFASEIWADGLTLQSQFNRNNSYQIIRAKLTDPGNVKSIEDFIKNDKRLNLEIKTEKDYFKSQTKGTGDLIFKIGIPLSIIMAFGAIAGSLNTMYNSVAQRTTEVATLRAIGFSSMPVFIGTLVESLVLSLIGGVVGSIAAYLFFDGLTAATLGASFTQIVFDFQINSATMIDGIILALTIGFVGGVFPAARASRLPVVAAFSAAQ